MSSSANTSSGGSTTRRTPSIGTPCCEKTWRRTTRTSPSVSHRSGLGQTGAGARAPTVLNCTAMQCGHQCRPVPVCASPNPPRPSCSICPMLLQAGGGSLCAHRRARGGGRLTLRRVLHAARGSGPRRRRDDQFVSHLLWLPHVCAARPGGAAHARHRRWLLTSAETGARVTAARTRRRSGSASRSPSALRRRGWPPR